jgi:hypothetical protein
MGKIREISSIVQSTHNQVIASYLTAVNGTPGAGQFRSDINNRGPIIGNDLKVVKDIERFSVQDMVLIHNENGPAGEQVWKPINDLYDRVRIVAGTRQAGNFEYGRHVNVPQAGYIEIQFYGTGLNLLQLMDGGSRDLIVSIDGAGEVTRNYVATGNILGARGYAPNAIFLVASGLTYGLHTARIRSSSATVIYFGGYEVLNESTSLRICAGSAIVNGVKVTLSSDQLIPYNSSFESGTLGTRGGHVSVYLKEDGSIGKAVTPTAAASATGSSANHATANEEVIRNYFWREFGTGHNINTDFATLTASGSGGRNHTLDDATTNLVGNNIGTSLQGGIDTLRMPTIGAFVDINWIGTGFDIVGMAANASASPQTFQVDGGSSIVLSTSGWQANIPRVEKIVSGLPYGSHTVRINFVGASPDLNFTNFLIYGPKKPEVPAGAMELGDYNILADYVANSTNGQLTVATGVMRKFWSQREAIHSGTWSISQDLTGTIGGNNSFTSTNGSAINYTFTGTGFEVRGESTASLTGTVELKAGTGSFLAATTANFPTLSGASYATGFVFNPATGALTTTGAVGHTGFKLSGLPYGTYTVRITNTSVQLLRMHAIDIITPLHVHHNAGPHVLQNALPIGSTGIKDNRIFGNQLLSEKSTISGKASMSTSRAVTAASYTATEGGVAFYVDEDAEYDLEISGILSSNSASIRPQVSIYLDGFRFGAEPVYEAINTSGHWVTCAGSAPVKLKKGHHYIALFLKINGANILGGVGDSSYVSVKKRGVKYV